MKKLTTIITLLFTLISIAQTKEIDSLKKLVKTKIPDSTKVKALGDLCWYFSSISTDSSLYYGNLALDLSIKTNNNKGIAQAHNDFGIIYYKLSEFDKSIASYKKALIIRKKLKDTLGMGSLYNKMGIAYQRIFKMDSAIYFNTKALQVYQKANHQEYVALIKNNIANIYFNLKQYKRALKEHLEAAKIRTSIGDNFGLVHSYTNIGNSYLFLKDTVQSISNYQKGIKIAEANNYQQELASLYNNYGGILKDQKKHKEALIYFNKALKIRDKLNDSFGLASVNLNLADMYLTLGNINIAEKHNREALKIAKKINTKEQEMNAYKGLLRVFAYKKIPDSIIHYEGLHSMAQDSLFNTRVTKEIAEIQEKYNTVEREKEISKQKEQLLKNELEIKTKNTYALLLGAGLLVFGIISFALYKRQQHKRREYKTKLKLKEAQTYSKLQDQRLHISRDLHDNIGSQLTFIISSIDNLKFLTDASNEKLRNKLTEINQFAGSTISQLRDTIWAMNKNEITYEDFHGRVLSLIEKAKASSNNIQFKFNSTIDNTFIFSSVKGINVFRIIQEAINNTLKYAEATEVSIEIYENDTEVFMEIKDNGKGFDMNTVSIGNGLENMQQRVKELDGAISIFSEINKGTTINLSCSKNKANDV